MGGIVSKKAPPAAAADADPGTVGSVSKTLPRKSVLTNYGPLTMLPGDQYGILEEHELGRGAYSVVHLGVKRVPHPAPDEAVAVKCIDTAKLKPRELESLRDEVRAMRV